MVSFFSLSGVIGSLRRHLWTVYKMPMCVDVTVLVGISVRTLHHTHCLITDPFWEDVIVASFSTWTNI